MLALLGGTRGGNAREYYFYFDAPEHLKFILAFLVAAEPMKVKKTDLPVLPPEQDVLPSLDDEEDDSQSADDDDEDEDDMDDDMMADEAASEPEDDDYDDDELDESEQDDEDAWSSNLSTSKAKKEPPTTTAAASAKTTTLSPSLASSAEPAVDPYFTHFDPRAEHQSFKVI